MSWVKDWKEALSQPPGKAKAWYLSYVKKQRKKFRGQESVHDLIWRNFKYLSTFFEADERFKKLYYLVFKEKFDNLNSSTPIYLPYHEVQNKTKTKLKITRPR